MLFLFLLFSVYCHFNSAVCTPYNMVFHIIDAFRTNEQGEVAMIQAEKFYQAQLDKFPSLIPKTLFMKREYVSITILF